VAELHPRTRWSLDFHGHDAGEILAKIEDMNAASWRGDSNGFDLLDSPHGHTRKSRQFGRPLESEIHVSSFHFQLPARTGILKLVEGSLHRAVVLGTDRRLPFAVVETRARPTWHLLACVVGFAHEKIGLLDRSFSGDFPGRISNDCVSRAIRVFNFQLRHECRRFPVSIAADVLGPDPGQQSEADIT